MESQRLSRPLHSRRQITAPPDDSGHDAELIERYVTSHDGAAFSRLVERHGPRVQAVCRRVLRNHHDAEDAFQATFLVLARKARHIRQRDALASWLYKVAYQLSVKLRTSVRRRRQLEQQPPPAPRLADDQITWGDLRMVLDEELDRLPEKYRAPLLLCCLSGRTRDEAAEQLGWTLGALKMRLERGRQLLRTRLARRGLMVSAVLVILLLVQHTTVIQAAAVLAMTTIRTSLRFTAGTTATLLSAQPAERSPFPCGAEDGSPLRPGAAADSPGECGGCSVRLASGMNVPARQAPP
jgi:RNA polymerase sigma factor (sigma-70 family)